MKHGFWLGILIMVFIGTANQTQAFSWSDVAPTKIFSTLDLIVDKVTGLVFYLSKQKDYLLGDQANPNDYHDFSAAPDIEKVVTDLGGKTEPEKKVVSEPIVVSTSTLPEVKKIEPIPVKTSPKIPDITLPPVVNLASTSVPKINNQFESSGDYSSSQILIYTNAERAKQSLLPLSSNKELDKVAKLKLDDLFAKQYFSHESPTGQSAADLAKQVGYGYLIIGENLALGNFGGDKGLVKAWMDSPGHRANILNGKFKELGVAERQGDYEGRNVTIAVQIFGNPLTACTKPSPSIQNLIDNSSVSIKKAETQAKIMYDSLVKIKDDPELDKAYYNQKIQEYNYYAKNINTAIINLKRVTSEFNQQVADYNYCISH